MSQKIENQLNLALDITEEERQKSESLDIGYDLEEKEWELIVKYSGTLERVRTRAVYVTEPDRWICHYPNKRKSDKRTGSISRSRIYRKTKKFIFSNREWKACVLY